MSKPRFVGRCGTGMLPGLRSADIEFLASASSKQNKN